MVSDKHLFDMLHRKKQHRQTQHNLHGIHYHTKINLPTYYPHLPCTQNKKQDHHTSSLPDTRGKTLHPIPVVISYDVCPIDSACPSVKIQPYCTLPTSRPYTHVFAIASYQHCEEMMPQLSLLQKPSDDTLYSAHVEVMLECGVRVWLCVALNCVNIHALSSSFRLILNVAWHPVQVSGLASLVLLS